MQSHKFILNTIICLLTFTFINCATVKTPDNYLAESKNMDTEPYGGWIEIKYNIGSDEEQLVSGELIALSKDSVYVASDNFFVFAKKDITSAKMVIYNSHGHLMGSLVIFGTLSTLSNGFYLLLTAPIWLIGGTISSSKRSFEPIIDYPGEKLEDMSIFARFPSGLPEGIDRSKIKRKL